MTPEASYREWCKLEDYVFSRKDDIWDRLVKPVLTEITLELEALDGKINLEMNNILLTALLVAPNEEELEKSAAAIEQERRRQFAERYPWEPPPDEPMPPVEGKDFLFFQKYGDDVVCPWSRPKAHELSDIARVFAARGEQELIRFGILPIRDLPELLVTVGDFSGAAGTLSLDKHADFWRERYKERGCESTRGKIDEMWRLNPISYVLQENAPQPGEAGTPRMYVLDLRVPESAAPGDYFAPVTLKSDGKVIGSAQLQLKVLPFKLHYEGAASFNFQMGYNDWADWMPGYTRESATRTLENKFAFLDKYFFQNNYFYPWGYAFPGTFRFGTISGEPGSRNFSQTPEQAANMEWWFRQTTQNDAVKSGYFLLKGFGLMYNCGWRPSNIFSLIKAKKAAAEQLAQWESDLKDLERIVGQVTQLCKDKGYPQPYWYFTGELDNYGVAGTKEAVRLAEAVRRAGAVSLVTINGRLAYKHTPAVFDHIWANPATPVDEALVAEIKRHGHKFGTHNSGDTRFQAGFQFWRTGGEGRHQETPFYTSFLLPYSLLPWNYNTAQAYPAPGGGWRPTLHFLNYRDGRDDYLYLYTLEAAMQKAPKNASSYQEAEKFLTRLKEKIHFDPRKYHVAKFDGIEGTAAIDSNEWNSTSLERYRWKIANLIMQLEKDSK